MEKERDFGLDLTRMTAGLLTLSVHFFLNNDFYITPAAGKSMLAACMVRMACMTCVPLFMLLTGYLCINRRLGPGYYRKLLPILLTYLLSGGACVAFRFLWLGERYSLRHVAGMFTTYTAAPYGWYVGMYIGLFLLSPFLNAVWHGLDRRGKRTLLLTLAGLTALPSLTNQWGTILPDWWIGIYPLTYYAAGAWLRENPVRVKPWQLFLCWLALATAVGAKGYFTAGGGAYPGVPEDYWGSLFLLVQAVLLFSCLRQCGGERVPAAVRWLVSRGAKLALGMYLISYIPDRLIYPVLAQAAPAYRRIWYMPLVTPAVVFCSAVLAQPVDWAVEALMGIIPTRVRAAAGAQRRDPEES